jgi:peptide/nickel transport system ATP-binding protein
VRGLEVKSVSREASTVNGVSFTVRGGEVLCVIGESGSGKSETMRALRRLNPKRRTVTAGSIRVANYDILALTETEMTRVRGSTIAMVFQEPMTALDPVYTIGDQIAETVMRHEGISRRAAMERALELLLRRVRVPSPERRLRAFPDELSGGLRQPAMMAGALSCRPMPSPTISALRRRSPTTWRLCMRGASSNTATLPMC